MLTPDEIRNITFTKGIGGYKTSEVDIFIDQCADTVEALLAEKAELSKKLEILADKLVEYRNDEDSIRTALLSAQRLGDTVVREANHKAGLILDDAKIKAQKMQENAQRSIASEQEELRRIQREIASFKSRMLSIYREHLSLIDVLPEPEEEREDEAPLAETRLEEAAGQTPVAVADETEPPAAQEEMPPAAAQEETVFEPAVIPPLASQETVKTAPPPMPSFSRSIPLLDEEDVELVTASDRQEEPEEPRTSSRFADLKFGEDYDISNDHEDSHGLFRRKK